MPHNEQKIQMGNELLEFPEHKSLFQGYICFCTHDIHIIDVFAKNLHSSWYFHIGSSACQKLVLSLSTAASLELN